MSSRVFSIAVSLLALGASRTVLADDVKPIHALLVIGGCCHDYSHQQYILTTGISARANVEWTIVHEGDGTTTHKMSIYDNPDWAKGYDIVVHDECCADVKDKDFVEGILKPHRAGLPAVNLHCAMHCYRVSFDNFKDWFEFTGLDTRAHGAQLPIALNFVNQDHPITQGVTNWTTINEELYNNLQIWPTDTPLVYGRQGNDNNMVAWVNNYHGTRVFSTTLGHNNETCNDPRYLDLVTRGLLWAVDKLNADYLKPARHVLAEPPARHAAQKLVPVNLALLKPASADASQDGHDPSQAVDDDSDTRWCASDGGNGHWWQVDLQKPQDITGCQITWEKDVAPYQYRIEGSADGQIWRTLAVENDGKPRPQTDAHKFDASGIRFMRVTVTVAPPYAWASFYEVQVWGKTMVSVDFGQVDPRIAGTKVPPGFEKSFFAGPPDVSYPTCISAAPTGEVFVGVDQNGSIDQQTNRGWVVRCIDTNGDGVADTFNIFAKMDSPRGIVFDNNVLYVMHPPVLEAFYDDTGSGVANRSEVLVRGLSHDLHFRGADHTCNGVRMGIDGWLYIALGDYGALEAVGKDGAKIQLHGGGVVRVRPDGTGLEIFSSGTRNIYDVAMDPFMDVFTCDNTNDGDDWNVRLSHMIATARYGYPSLFRNFSDEMIATMADYGGGAPTGSLFLDEPGFPGDFGHGLYCCQWGWDSVTRHPLTPAGASFTPGKESFIHLPRPTGIDEDGEGNLYVASWNGATFTYAGQNVGYIMRVRPAGYTAPKFPDLKQVSNDDLVDLLGSPSAVWRLHIQREILRRGKNTRVSRGLEKLAKSDASQAVRVAAIYTLNQLLGSSGHGFLLQLAQDDTMRQYALRAMSDRKEEAADLPTEVFTHALSDPNPPVRLQAVIALDRLHRTESAGDILPLTADADPSVAHVAFRALVAFDAGDVCFNALRQNNAVLIPGAMRVLRNLHQPAVVGGLIEELGGVHDSTTRALIFQALCRLYYREADYDGSWWGTRPDTSGPYFKPVVWEESPRIGQAIVDNLAKADEPTLKAWLPEMQRHKLNLPDATPAILRAATNFPSLRAPTIAIVRRSGPFTQPLISFLNAIVRDAHEDAGIRTSAFHGLEKVSYEAPEHSDRVNAMTAILDAASEFAESPAIKPLRAEYIADVRAAKNCDDLIPITETGLPGEQDLGCAVLVNLATNPNSPKEEASKAQEFIKDSWASPRLPSLLRAISETGSTNYMEHLSALTTDPNHDIAELATAVYKRVKSPEPVHSTQANLISKMTYEEASHEAIALVGDPVRGAQLFDKLGCVKCHTTAKDQPLKGPFLGDISKRYGSAEIVESILKPSAKIAQGFTTTILDMADGSDHEGFIVRESGDTVELRNLAGAIVLPKKDITGRRTSKLSVMPEGLFDQSTPADLAGMLAYLKSLAPEK